MRTAFFSNRHVNFVPLLLRGTVCIFLQRASLSNSITIMFLYPSGNCILIGRVQTFFKPGVVDGFRRPQRLGDLFVGGPCFPLHSDDVNHRFGFPGAAVRLVAIRASAAISASSVFRIMTVILAAEFDALCDRV